MSRRNEKGSFKPTVVTLAALLLSSMLILMGGAAVAPALPDITAYFAGESSFLVSLIITLPSLSVAIFGFAVGILADKLGKVKVLTISLLIFTIAGAIGFFLDELGTLLVFRFILGIGIAGITSTVTALIAEYYSGVSRTKVLSYQSAAMGIGVLILEFTGGSLAEISWREPFLIYLIGLPIMLLVIFSMREPKVEEPSADVKAMERSQARPINKGYVVLCYVAIIIVMMMVFILPTRIPYYMGELGVSSSLVGLFLGAHGVANAAVSIAYRQFSQRFNPFLLLGAGFVVMFIGLVLTFIVSSVVTAVAMLIIVGVGVGMTVPSIANTLAGEVTNSNSGKIMGGYGTCLSFGQFIISLLSVPLFDMVGGSYPGLFAVMGAISLVSGVLILAWYGLRFRNGRSARATAQ